ncbi:MAG TPA: polysaccharide deacetylase family protein [Allosphingosinicella sp.]
MANAMWRSARIRWSAATLILTLAVLAALHAIGNARCFTLVGEIVCRVETDKPMVALTFDDGPTERGVDSALAALRSGGARATFFLIGREAASGLALSAASSRRAMRSPITA